MQIDMFLKLSNIKGDSADAQHSGEIDIDSMSWGIQLGLNTGARGGVGRVENKGITLTKSVDSASPALRAHCCSGTLFDEAVIIKRKAGKVPLDYLKVTLKNVLIAQLNTELTEGEQPDYEILTLSFDEYTEEYRPQNNDGTGGAVIRHGFDFLRNKKT